MIVVQNDSKAVKVLKAWKNPDLRIFPGVNRVDLTKDEFKKIYLATPVNKAMFKECMKTLGESDLDTEEKEQAKAAKKKNDSLNNGKPVPGKGTK